MKGFKHLAVIALMGSIIFSFISCAKDNADIPRSSAHVLDNSDNTRLEVNREYTISEKFLTYYIFQDAKNEKVFAAYDNNYVYVYDTSGEVPQCHINRAEISKGDYNISITTQAESTIYIVKRISYNYQQGGAIDMTLRCESGSHRWHCIYELGVHNSETGEKMVWRAADLIAFVKRNIDN
jgi:hypothetical protein